MKSYEARISKLESETINLRKSCVIFGIRHRENEEETNKAKQEMLVKYLANGGEPANTYLYCARSLADGTPSSDIYFPEE